MLRRGGHGGLRVSVLIAALVLVTASVEAGGIRPGGNAAGGGGFWQQLLAWAQAWSLDVGLTSSLGKHGSSIDPNGGGPGGSGATVTAGTTPQQDRLPDSLGEIR